MQVTGGLDNVFSQRFVLFLLVALLTSASKADPNVLLGEAIKISVSISENMPTKGRLEAYRETFNKIDAIVTDYPSSDQAIKILSDQAIGSFNPSALRREFVDELTQYYDIVCETSPS